MEDTPEFPFEGRILIITNLSYETAPKEIYDHFQRFGRILRVDVGKHFTGGSDGKGYIEFESKEDCEAATSLHATIFGNRTIKCRVCTQPPPELKKEYNKRFDSTRKIPFGVKKRVVEELVTGNKREHQKPQVNKRNTELAKSMAQKRKSKPSKKDEYSEYESSEYEYEYQYEYSD